jgi:hypothetical protein
LAVYARSTTINGKPENVDAEIRYVENEVFPMITQIAGCRGLSLFVDRQSGRAIASSSLDSEEAMRPATSNCGRPGARREMFGGSMQIDEWEIGPMHRTQHGSCCWVTWVQGEDLNRALEILKVGVLPEAEATQGFCGASLLMNRPTGLACTTTAWESREEMEASRTRADEQRQRATQEADSRSSRSSRSTSLSRTCPYPNWSEPAVGLASRARRPAPVEILEAPATAAGRSRRSPTVLRPPRPAADR